LFSSSSSSVDSSSSWSERELMSIFATKQREAWEKF
jgi:hypothetical protein